MGPEQGAVIVVLCILSALQVAASSPVDAKFTQEKSKSLKWQSLFPATQFNKVNQQGATQCQYEMCNAGKADMLNVHLVPHTHDDVGWLKTVDQYFYGSHNNIQTAGVRYILDNVINELRQNPNRKFIYVEIAFFYRWWNEQSDSMRHWVKGLVNNGQLQFILGGWSMNDEASTHYNAIIDQHTLGFRFLEDTFGECGRPRIGWQIDPFGHSRELASFFAQFGFDGYFFGRLDYQDKDKRLKDKTMEMMWTASQSLGEQGFVFTGVNFNGYSAPDGFCFDIGCDDEPVMDDRRLEDFNVDDRVSGFLKAVSDQAQYFSTNNIMLTMGNDFNYQNAKQNFINIDKIIQYVNERQANGSKVNAFYSTPQCYLLALNKANKTWSTKSDDFFPYAHRPHSFWTGYFTSRPALKGYVRQTNNFLQACKQLDALADLEAEYGSDLKIKALEQSMGVAQHHDAVSGTEKQHVANDYAKRLSKGNAGCQEVISDSYSKLVPKSDTALPAQSFCPLSNITYCSFTEHNDKMSVIVYNPVGRAVNYVVRVPVAGSGYRVMDASGKTLTSQMVPVSQRTASIPERKGSVATSELLFEASLPPLGFNTYFVEKTAATEKKIVPEKIKKGFFMKNEHLAVHFDEKTGVMSHISLLKDNTDIDVTQNFYYYNAFAGNNSEDKFQASGAYIFRPQGSAQKVSTSVTTVNISGELVQEVRQTFSDWVSQVIRVYKDSPFVEFEWTVGPIPIDDNTGKEVVSRFNTNLQHGDVFYTDSNGREMLQRVNNYRPTWKLNQSEIVAGNYYPVNSRIFIQDPSMDAQVTVLTDRSQGGGSTSHGNLELMVHRRLLFDDALGVGEPLNETGADGKGLIVRGKHYLLVGSLASANKSHRDLAEKLFMAPVVSYAANPLTPQDYSTKFLTSWTGLKNSGKLPDNVHLLTLQGWRAKTILVRLEHFYEKGDDSTLSQPATVSLKDLFTGLEMVSMQELTLGANKNLSEATRLVWDVQNYGRTKADMSSYVTPVNGDSWDVLLNPMQIRTFQIEIK